MGAGRAGRRVTVALSRDRDLRDHGTEPTGREVIGAREPRDAGLGRLPDRAGRGAGSRAGRGPGRLGRAARVGAVAAAARGGRDGPRAGADASSPPGWCRDGARVRAHRRRPRGGRARDGQRAGVLRLRVRRGRRRGPGAGCAGVDWLLRRDGRRPALGGLRRAHRRGGRRARLVGGMAGVPWQPADDRCRGRPPLGPRRAAHGPRLGCRLDVLGRHPPARSRPEADDVGQCRDRQGLARRPPHRQPGPLGQRRRRTRGPHRRHRRPRRQRLGQRRVARDHASRAQRPPVRHALGERRLPADLRACWRAAGDPDR